MPLEISGIVLLSFQLFLLVPWTKDKYQKHQKKKREKKGKTEQEAQAAQTQKDDQATDTEKDNPPAYPIAVPEKGATVLCSDCSATLLAGRAH